MVEAPDLVTLIDDAEGVLALLARIDGGRIEVHALDGDVVRSFGSVPGENASSAEKTLRIEAEPVATVHVDGSRAEDTLQLTLALLAATYRRKLVAGLYEETVSGSYEELRSRNRELETLNVSLAEQVRVRTRELDEVHVKLAAEEHAAAVGRLAAGVAHELNTPLACVRSNLGWLAGVAPDDGDSPEVVRESIEMVDRATRIVKDLRAFSHVDDVSAVVTDLNDEVDRALSQLTVPEGVTVEKGYGVLAPVRAEGRLVSVALLHLLENARDAVVRGGCIRITTRVDGGRVAAEIRDDGEGVPSELRPHLFEPFFTTKELGRGTGLGLTVARNIARAHGGDLELTFPSGGGTVARFSLGGMHPEVTR